MKKYFVLFLCLAPLFFPLNAQHSIQNFRVNYEVTPIGSDFEVPQFSWQMKAEGAQQGYQQKAFQIQVYDENNQMTWDSEEKTSDISHAIQYEGEKLKPTTRYTCLLKVWDNFGNESQTESWFETGFLNPSIDAWSGAKWIGGGDEDLVFHSQYQSVFQIGFSIQLDEKSNSTKASFLFGANDYRLMKQHLNLMGVENEKNENYIALELDISNLDTGGVASLNIYRVGYTATDSSDKPFKSIAIPKEVINQENKYQQHLIYMTSVFGMCEFYIGGTDERNKLYDPALIPDSPFAGKGLNLNPIGLGNNAICFPHICDIGFKTSKGQSAFFSNITIQNIRKPANLLFSDSPAAKAWKAGSEKSRTPLFSVLPRVKGKYIIVPGKIITADPSRNAVPLLRSEFDAKKNEIEKARLYITARGIYEVFINGKRVGDDYFNPGLTQYNRHHMYQTYDVTEMLNSSGSENAIGASLAEGWFSGNSTFSGDNWNFFGDRQSLLAKLVINHKDGSEQVITSNEKDWKIFTDGPIRVGSFFQGEVYDATKEKLVEGWTTANFDDSNWKQAQEVSLKSQATLGSTTDFLGRENILNYDDCQLIGQYGNNAKIVKTLTAISVNEVRPNVYVYDMGQNMVGVPKLKIENGNAGQLINIRFAEVLYPDLPEYKDNVGMVVMENLRTAHATDQYILKGDFETIQPRFTFHGYRFLEITGLEEALPLEAVQGLVISSVTDLSAHYETDNPGVNKLWENISWSLRSNFLSIPTDCPQRNERMGWSGDISVFSKSATYLTDANLFLRRHLLAMRDVQAENGRFTDVAPMGGGFGGTLWGSAGITVAKETYNKYGDLQLLQEHYDAMKKYIFFLETKVNEQGILVEGPLGDWLSPEGSKNDNTLFWMAYFAYDLQIMSDFAKELGRTEETESFKNKSEAIKKIFNEVYVDKETHRTIKSGIPLGFFGPPKELAPGEIGDKGLLIDTQASYAIPLALNTFNETNRPFAEKYLNETVRRENTDDDGILRPPYSLMTGFIGTASISEALSKQDRDDMAYQLLVNKKYPSWLYSVENGATTIWERLNSFTRENGFGGNNSMNSFNHYSFGSVAGWMCEYSLGIQRDPEVAGYKHFILSPRPDWTNQIRTASGHYDSVYGRIESQWNTKGAFTYYKFTIPANTTATLQLQADHMNLIKYKGKPISNWPGVSDQGRRTHIPLKSGTYEFSVRWAE